MRWLSWAGLQSRCNIKAQATEAEASPTGCLRMLVLCLLLAAAFLPAPTSAAPTTYRFDPVHTQIWFSVGHEGFSHPLGRLRVADGWFAFDAGDWSASRIDVTIDMASADLGDGKWNETVKSSQFLDVEKFPTAHYVGTKVEKTGARTGIIHGNLDFHGRRLPVDVAFTFNRSGNDPYTFRHKTGFSAIATLQRSAFGLERYKDVVGDEVTLRLEVEGMRDRDGRSHGKSSANDTQRERK